MSSPQVAGQDGLGADEFPGELQGWTLQLWGGCLLHWFLIYNHLCQKPFESGESIVVYILRWWLGGVDPKQPQRNGIELHLASTILSFGDWRIPSTRSPVSPVFPPLPVQRIALHAVAAKGCSKEAASLPSDGTTPHGSPRSSGPLHVWYTAPCRKNPYSSKKPSIFKF